MAADSATSDPDRLVRRLSTLADPARLRLLRLLEAHELGVAELCDVLQMPQSTVSRHLRALVDDGWAVARKQGTTNLYRTHLDELEPDAAELWHTARAQCETWPALEQDRLRLARTLAARTNDPRAFFAGAATEWDALRTELYGRTFNLAALLALLPGRLTVADLGCGTGVQAAALAPHVERVIAVDSSPEMLDAARRHTADLGNVDLRTGDLTALPIDDATCDAALAVLVLTYLDDPAAALAEMRRILKDHPPHASGQTSGGGKAVIVDLLRHDRDDFRRRLGQRSMGFSPDQLATLLADAGFADPRATPLPPDPATTGPALLLATAAI